MNRRQNVRRAAADDGGGGGGGGCRCRQIVAAQIEIGPRKIAMAGALKTWPTVSQPVSADNQLPIDRQAQCSLQTSLFEL